MHTNAYSSRLKLLQKEQIQQLKNDYQEENSSLAARSHRLHVETNRRRRAYAQKKKTQAEKEESRCRIILAKRKQHIQEATEKFQRMHRPRRSNSPKDDSPKTEYTLDEALHMIRRQGRLNSASPPNVYDYSADKRPGSVPLNFNNNNCRGLTSTRYLFEQQLSQRQNVLAAQQQMALRDFTEAVIGDGAAVKIADSTPINVRMHSAGAKTTAMAHANGTVMPVLPQETNNLVKGEQSNARVDELSEAMRTASTKIAVSQHTNVEKGLKEQSPSFRTGDKSEHNCPVMQDNLDFAALKQTNLVENREERGNGKFLEDVNPLNGKPNGWHLNFEDQNNNNSKAKDVTIQQNKDFLMAGNTQKIVNSIFAKADHLPVNDVYGAKESHLNKQNLGISAERGLLVQANAAVRNILPNKVFMFGDNGPPAFSVGPGGDNASTVGFLLNRNVSIPSPNIAVVQPNCHTNIFNADQEQETAKQEVSKADVLNTNFKNEPVVSECSDGNSRNRTGLERATIELAPGQTAPDPGTFFISSGLPFTLKSQITVPAKQDTCSVVVSDSLEYQPDSKIGEGATMTDKLAPAVNQGFFSAGKAKVMAIDNKPPTGRHKIDEVVRQDSRPPDAVNQETKRWQTAVDERQRDSQAKDFRQPDSMEQDLQGMALKPADFNQKMTVSQNNTPMNGNIQGNAGYLDEIFSDEGSSNSSASSIRPVSRIPVPSSASKVPKGILKTQSSGYPASDGSGQEQSTGAKWSANRGTTSVSLRDSLEVMKLHRRDDVSVRQTEKNQKSSKKSVRFAEVLCELEPSQPMMPSDNQQQLFFIPRPPVQEKMQTKHSSLSRPMRPISARVMSVTSPVNPDVKVPRVASAGVTRRGPFHNPPMAPSNSPQPSSASNVTSVQPSSNPGYQSDTAPNLPSASASNGKLNANLAEEKPAQDISGISLDKTPTEEEINWLWQKVRSCLNREPASVSPAAANSNRALSFGNGNVPPSTNGVSSARQTVQVSCTNFDGSVLTSRPGSGRVNTTYVNNFMGTQNAARRRVTMETLSAYTKKTNNNLLQQRRIAQPSTATALDYTELPTGETTFADAMGKVDMNSTSRVASVTSRNPVSESMAAFLAGEDLSGHVNVDDSIIVNVMNAAERRARSLASGNLIHSKVPSALSLEEERLMKSIDRLNEKLIGQTAYQQNASESVIRPFAPKPPPYAHAKTRQPASNSRRFTYTGTIPRHYFQISRPVSVGNGDVNPLQ